MDMANFLPNKNISPSNIHDKKSIYFLKTTLPVESVDCVLQESGTLPNIDGYLDLLCDDGTAFERIVVQVKHLTHQEKNGDVYYDIPKSIYAYAERHKGEVVVFIACDYEREIFYWRYINSVAIEEYKTISKHIQGTSRYHFKPEETCSKSNVYETIAFWRTLYQDKMDSIKDDKQLAKNFALIQKASFNNISSELHEIKKSHIKRAEVERLVNWIYNGSSNKNCNLCLLVGDAGVGKSVVIKNLIDILSKSEIKYICIKADTIDDTNNPVSLESMYNAITCFASDYKKVVLIIDQIDVLSQSLSNDRNHLNIMMSILTTLGEWPNVMAIVSCRKYDLEFDAALSRLKDKSETIELGLLSDEVVVNVLNKLENGLKDRLNPITFNILKTVQYLNVFCFLYQRNRSKLDFGSPIELYDSLWDSAIDGAPSSSGKEDVEKILFNIAECVKKLGTLKPVWIPSTKQKKSFSYLASCGVIKVDLNTVSFFHQTFYDYALARFYTAENKSYISDLEGEFQGLEIRSTVKAVLDYNRGHSDFIYATEIKNLLSSDKIRLHIKLLAMSILATANVPKNFEKKIVKSICKTNEKLLNHFFRGAQSDQWFNLVVNLSKTKLSDSTRENYLLLPILNCLSRYSFNHPDEVFSLINSIKDDDTRSFSLAYILRGHNDYRNNKVVNAFCLTSHDNMVFIVNGIQDAMLSNKSFGLDETRKRLLKYLKSSNHSRNHDDYKLVSVLCKQLCQKYPKDFFLLFHKCFVQMIKDTSFDGSYGFTVTKVFNGISVDKYIDELLEMYEQLLIKYSSDYDLIKPIVKELIVLNNETSISMAFIAMAEHPKAYDETVVNLLSDNALIEKYLHGDIKFFFLKMLKAWYLALNKEQIEWYQKRILSYTSSMDFVFDRERRWSDLLCPYLWRDKWDLICNTLPDGELLPEMKKCSQELWRRFGRKSLIKRSDHSISCAVYCGGIVNEKIYTKFPINNWLSSFLKLEENREWRRDRRPISLQVHADAFKKCIAAKPYFFKDFVFELVDRYDIKEIYKVAGLEGLLEGGIDVNKLWPLASKYITVNYAEVNSYSFSRIVNHYFKNDNEYIDQILPILKMILKSPFENRFLKDENETELNNIVNHMLTNAINSKQGRALKLIIHLCGIPERRKQAYTVISDAVPFLHNYLNTLPLHYLYMKDYYDKGIFLPLMKSLLNNMGPEALVLRGDAIQWCFYHKREIVSKFIDRIETDSRSHELLSLIYFYGLCQGKLRKDCEERLEKILLLNDEKVISALVKVSMKMFSNTDYTDYSRKYLERYSSDDRDSVISAFCLYCDVLPVDAFNFYRGLVKTWKNRKHRDIDCQLEYVTKCIEKYPIECYQFIQNLGSTGLDDVWLADEEVVKVLLMIYGKLRQDENEEVLNEIMDMFDEYIFRGNRVMYTALGKVS